MDRITKNSMCLTINNSLQTGKQQEASIRGCMFVNSCCSLRKKGPSRTRGRLCRGVHPSALFRPTWHIIWKQDILQQSVAFSSVPPAQSCPATLLLNSIPLFNWDRLLLSMGSNKSIYYYFNYTLIKPPNQTIKPTWAYKSKTLVFFSVITCLRGGNLNFRPAADGWCERVCKRRLNAYGSALTHSASCLTPVLRWWG